MNSQIAQELKLKYQPVAILFTDEKPEDALQYPEGRWGCVIAMLTAAAKGRTAVFSRETTGCYGGRVGLGFGDAYEEFPGGIEYFLSTGAGEGYREGEAYKKTPEIAKALIDSMPIQDTPFKYVVFKPLDQVDPARETPVLVCFYANPDQLSALVVLANYNRTNNETAMFPMGSGCSTICLLPYAESKKEKPRAVVGVADISARPYVDPDILTFTVPYAMFQEMEADIPGSFLEKHDWKKVHNRIADPG